MKRILIIEDELERAEALLAAPPPSAASLLSAPSPMRSTRTTAVCPSLESATDLTLPEIRRTFLERAAQLNTLAR